MENIITPSDDQPSAKRFLEAKELADYLELPTLSTIYRWAKNGIIPHRKMGGRIFFIKKEIDQWIVAEKGGFND